MKATLLAFSGVVLLLVAGAFAWSAYDYSLICTKCLASQQVVEQRIMGLTLRTTTSEGEKGEDYERIYGRPCEHVFHQGGFGRRRLFSIACGMTAEGLWYEPRDRAITMAYYAEKQHSSEELAKRTFSLIDRLAPPDKFPSAPKDEASMVTDMTLSQLATYLRRAESVEDWSRILDSAGNHFTDTAGLPVDRTPNRPMTE